MWMAIAKARKDIPLGENVIKKGTEIEITHGKSEKYMLWEAFGSLWDLPEEYVKKIKVKVKS